MTTHFVLCILYVFFNNNNMLHTLFIVSLKVHVNTIPPTTISSVNKVMFTFKVHFSKLQFNIMCGFNVLFIIKHVFNWITSPHLCHLQWVSNCQYYNEYKRSCELCFSKNFTNLPIR